MNEETYKKGKWAVEFINKNISDDLRNGNVTLLQAIANKNGYNKSVVDYSEAISDKERHEKNIDLINKYK